MDPHPRELAGLDLHETWTGVPELTTSFDPFRFEERMAAYRRLIVATNGNGLFGIDNRQNLLWGLMFQHQWQFRTGRLGSTSRVDGHIDPDAPWGYGNYALCVIPWLGASRAGVVPALPVADPPGSSRFCYVIRDRVPPEFEVGLQDWWKYFELVAETRPGADLEPLRMALWKAHKSCLDVVVERVAGIDPAPYAPVEIAFLQGWCRMVDYLWAAAWRTDFDFMIEHGSDVLPEYLLENEHHDAMTDKVRGNVSNIIGLARTPDWRYAVNLRLWTRAMRTRQARDDVVPLLDAVFNPSRENRGARRRMLRYLLQP